MEKLRETAVVVLDLCGSDDGGLIEGISPYVKRLVRLASIEELRAQPLSIGVLLVHDTGGTVTTLQRAMSAESRWRPHAAYALQPAPAQIVDAILGGAIDYLAPPVVPSALDTRLGQWPQRMLSSRNHRNRALAAKVKVSRLSPRELEVMQLVAQGETNVSIGEKLGISPRTAEIHRSQACKKLKARNATEAAITVHEAKFFV